VGLLAKHRALLDPSFNLRSGRPKLHAIARALIEALGGKQEKDGWEVDLSLEDGLAERLRVAEAEFPVRAKEAHDELMSVVDDLTAKLHAQEDRIKALEAAIQALSAEGAAPRKRASKADAQPDAKPDAQAQS
jgi:outer membrane murein-binding lipoprotein Lpp